MKMCYKIIILIAARLVLAAALALPAGHNHPEAMDLKDVIKSSVCPIELDTDINPERIPPIINLTKCAVDPLGSCRSHGIPLEDCCPRLRGDHITKCVEILDTVYVHFPKSSTPDVAMPYEVSVGCACVHQTIRSGIFATK